MTNEGQSARPWRAAVLEWRASTQSHVQQQPVELIERRVGQREGMESSLNGNEVGRIRSCFETGARTCYDAIQPRGFMRVTAEARGSRDLPVCSVEEGAMAVKMIRGQEGGRVSRIE